MIQENVPAIYVACLAAYNNGYLHGVWIDATQDVALIHKEISNMLKCSPCPNAEEWEIHTTSNMGNSLPQFANIKTVHDYALFIAEYGELGEAVLDYAYDLDHAKHLMDECYHGKYDSEEDYVRQFYEDCMGISSHLAFYINYEQIAHDMFLCDYFSLKVNCMFHIFHVD